MEIIATMDDVLVIGGGPVGLSAAIYAALAGLSVRILEMKSGVIDKACGEGLMPGGVKALQEMGVAIAQYSPLKGIRYVDNGKAAEGRFTHGDGWGIRRLQLHEALRTRALALGVTIDVHRANVIRQFDDHVEVDGYKARYVIGADGLHSPTRRKLNLEKKRPHYARYGLRRHFEVPSWTNQFVEIHLSPCAEAYVTPVSANVVGVAILFGNELHEKLRNADGKFYDNALNEFPALKARLENPCSKIQGSGPFKVTLKNRVAGRVLLVGDAAGYLDPMTGEGVRLGFATAKAAVKAICKSSPQSYERAWMQLTLRYWISTSAILQVRKSRWMSKLVVPLLSRAPRLFDWALAQMEK